MRTASFAILVVLLIAGGLSSGTAAAKDRREHGTHGTVRKLCATTPVERWPGGPRVGWARRGADMRRYWFRGAWALGVVQDAEAARGYVIQRAFCPPSAAGREALRRDRAAIRSGGRGGHGRSVALARPLQARICAPSVWLRDHPIDRAIGILFAGDVFTAHRRARNPWYGGTGAGHEHREGWVPRSALCTGLPRIAEGARLIDHDGFTLQVPPTTVACSARLVRRKLIAVGATFARGSRTTAVRADLVGEGYTEVGPIFRRGEAPSLARGAVGPFRCGHRQQVVYTVLSGARKGMRFRYPVTVGPRAETARASTTGRATAAAFHRPPSPGTSCSARPTLVYAHGHEGPVSHRYDARPAVAATGGTVAFDSPLALLAPDGGSDRDVYVRRGAKLVADSRLAPGSATSRAPAISGDGRRVAFESDDAGLAAGDRNGARDVFASDADGPPRLVSATRDGGSGNGRSRAPSLSADGRLIAFESRATDLVASAPPEGIYVADLATGSLRLAIADAYRPALSADGSTLVFETLRARSTKDNNKTWDVYALKLTDDRHRPVLVSATPRSDAARGRSLAGVPSADGRYVAFMSAASDVVAGDAGGVRDVFRRDLRARRTVLISRDRCGGFANGYSRYPSISADGRRVAFDSHAEDIVRAPSHGEGEVYVRDVPSGRTTLVSRRPDGRPGSRTSFSPAISADGRRVAFPSFSSDLTRGDTNKKVDQVLATVASGPVRRLS